MENTNFTVKMISQDGLDMISYDNNFYIEDGILYHGTEELSRDVEDDLLYAVQKIIDFCPNTVLEITDDNDEIVYRNEEYTDFELDELDGFEEDYKSLNESLEKFLEGDVVSFADFKRRKTAERRAQRNAEFEKEFGDELQKSADEWNKTNILLTIDKIKVNWVEGPIKNPHYKEGEEFSYENFQEDIWARDYMNQIQEKYDKCDITIFITTNQGEYNREYNYRFTIGSGKEECDIYQALELIVKSKEGKTPTITNDPIKYNENYYKSIAKEYGIEKQEPQEEPLPDYVRDYTKAPQDVAVGDILTCTWGYSMSLVDYYKVIERKAKSIKLARLQNKILTGGGYTGTCMPTLETKADQYVDGKLFRIGVKWSKDVVCQINGHSVYYWDGKPDSYDHMD